MRRCCTGVADRCRENRENYFMGDLWGSFCFKYKKNYFPSLPFPSSLPFPFCYWTRPKPWSSNWGNWGRELHEEATLALQGHVPHGSSTVVHQGSYFTLLGWKKPRVLQPVEWRLVEMLGCRSWFCLCCLWSGDVDSRTDSYWDRATAWPCRWWGSHKLSMS